MIISNAILATVHTRRCNLNENKRVANNSYSLNVVIKFFNNILINMNKPFIRSVCTLYKGLFLF